MLLVTRVTNIAVRRAQPADASAIRGLLNGAGLPVDAVDNEAVTHHVALNGSDIIGVAALEDHGDVALLRSVAVAPEWRRRGIASALVDAVEQSRGETTALYLFTETAEAFFRTLGFSKVQRAALPPAIAQCSQATSCCPVSAAVMRRDMHGRRDT